MLSFLPALLLLMFHGPSALERVLMDVHARQAEAVYQPIVGRRTPRSMGALIALAKNPAFTGAVAQYLQIIPDERRETASPIARGDASVAVQPSADHLRAGFSESDRSRDGPV